MMSDQDIDSLKQAIAEDIKSSLKRFVGQPIDITQVKNEILKQLSKYVPKLELTPEILYDPKIDSNLFKIQFRKSDGELITSTEELIKHIKENNDV